MTVTRELLEKFRVGDSISDQELAELIQFYTPLEASLRIMGMEYHLTWKEVRGDLARLKMYWESRRERKK